MGTVVLNKELQETLTRLYTELEGKHELSVSSPEYSQTHIESLYSYGLIKNINAGSFSGWAYIVQPTYEAEQEDGRILRSLKFRFPVFFNEQELYELDWDNESTVESVLLMRRAKR